MQNKKSRHRTPLGLRPVPSRTAGRRALWWSLIIPIVVAGVLFIRLAQQNHRRPHVDKGPISSEANFEIPSSGDTTWDHSWPELPQTGQPARPMEVVRAAYAYAMRREDVLKYMPCYCGCERQGHYSNHNCFVRGKTAAGAPAWDPMGYT